MLLCEADNGPGIVR